MPLYKENHSDSVSWAFELYSVWKTEFCVFWLRLVGCTAVVNCISFPTSTPGTVSFQLTLLASNSLIPHCCVVDNIVFSYSITYLVRIEVLCGTTIEPWSCRSTCSEIQFSLWKCARVMKYPNKYEIEMDICKRHAPKYSWGGAKVTFCGWFPLNASGDEINILFSFGG